MAKKVRKIKADKITFPNGTTVQYYIKDGKIVDDNDNPAPSAIAQAILAGMPLEDPPKPLPKKPRPVASPVVQQVAQEKIIEETRASSPVGRSKLDTLTEKTANEQKKLSSGKVEEKSKRSKVGTIARAAAMGLGGMVAGGSIDYLGLGGILESGVIMNALFPDKEDKNKSKKPKVSGKRGLTESIKGLNPLRGLSKTGSIDPESTKSDNLNVQLLKQILSAVENNSEALQDVSASLQRQETTDIEDRRELKQQNNEIIRLLEAIADGVGGGRSGNGVGAAAGGGTGGPGGGGSNLLESLAQMLGLGAVFKAGKGILKGAVKGAKFVGRGVAKLGGLAAGALGLKKLFGKT